ncbi:MAG TPA: tail fiber domain-containing protein [Pyrinomonadaceae bacterium]|jgi:hypothetical protein|nr:tail fiber domain-containing protein [Pyrinomonadaceae bacterium]
MKNQILLIALALIVVVLCHQTTLAQTTEFTYQGRLLSGGLPANGSHDFQFRLFDDPTGDTQVGPSITLTAVNVNNGVFSVRLDFGNQFPGANRFLEIRVKQSTDEFFSVLSPRQAITSAPYAIKSLNAENSTNAATATNAVQLNGLSATEYILTNDARLSDARNPLPNSSNYIQNSTSPQAGSNFNVTGNGTVDGTLSGNVINAATQFNIGGQRVLSVPGSYNTFAGINAGQFNTSGRANSFFGASAGQNTTSSENSFFGSLAGLANTTGLENSFFGSSAGLANTTGGFNSFFGKSAGQYNTTGAGNSFFGEGVGFNNTTGAGNSFFGLGSGSGNTTGQGNTMIGFRAGGAGNLTFATAIGALSLVSQNNSLVLGAINGVNGATADTNVGIGTTAPTQRLHIQVNGGNILFGGAGCLSGFAGIGFGTTLSGCANYSLLGNGTDTMINRPSGGSIYFRSGNANQVTINPSGIVAINTLGSAGSTALCRNSSNQISTCSSSIRYKSNIIPFSLGLSLIKKLRPVSFNWKDGGAADVGLVAEEVNRLEPLLTTINDKGEVEGVKYDRLGVLLINAVKEQQDQIQMQQRQIEALKRLICAQNAQAEVCKEGRK